MLQSEGKGILKMQPQMNGDTHRLDRITNKIIGWASQWPNA